MRETKIIKDMFIDAAPIDTLARTCKNATMIRSTYRGSDVSTFLAVVIKQPCVDKYKIQARILAGGTCYNILQR